MEIGKGKCNICEKTFSIASSLKKHIKHVHNKINIKCGICDKNFSSEQYLNVHINRIHVSNLPKVNCDICGKSFKNKLYLKQHIARVHQKSTAVISPICNVIMLYKLRSSKSH